MRPTVVILRSFRPVRPDRNGGALSHGRSGSIAWLNLTHLAPAGFDHAAASVRHATWRGRGLASLRTRAGLSDEGSDHHRTVSRPQARPTSWARYPPRLWSNGSASHS